MIEGMGAMYCCKRKWDEGLGWLLSLNLSSKDCYYFLSTAIIFLITSFGMALFCVERSNLDTLYSLNG